MQLERSIKTCARIRVWTFCVLVILMASAYTYNYIIYPLRNTDTKYDLSPSRKTWLHGNAPWLCIPKSNVPYRSQSNEDKAIVEQLYGGQPKCNGTIVEIGALDGVQYNNSWYFE